MVKYSMFCIALMSGYGLYAMDSLVARLEVDKSTNVPLEKIMYQFLHEPELFRKQWGTLPKDISKMLAQRVILEAALAPVFLSKVPIPSEVLWHDEAEETHVLACFNQTGDRVLIVPQGNEKGRLLVSENGNCIALLGRHPRFNEQGTVVASFLPKNGEGLAAILLHDTTSGEECARITVQGGDLNTFSFA